MDKRYQVFVSSTYADLKEERQEVIQALMEMDCIPAGMEMFPAADEDQWEFIKKVIDDCDYYLLIIGGRYGSLTASGISYTEKEYDYAVEKNLKVLALLHADPGSIPLAKSEVDPELRERLEAFRTKVSTGRLVKFWQEPRELPGMVALNLSKTIKAYPAVGWVRGDRVDSKETLVELHTLHRNTTIQEDRIKELTTKLDEYERRYKVNLSILDNEFLVVGKRKYRSSGDSPLSEKHEVHIKWRDIFAMIAPELLEFPSDQLVRSKLERFIFSRFEIRGYGFDIDRDCFNTVKLQLSGLGLVRLDYRKTLKGGMALFWRLTELGSSEMMKIRLVKS